MSDTLRPTIDQPPESPALLRGLFGLVALLSLAALLSFAHDSATGTTVRWTSWWLSAFTLGYASIQSMPRRFRPLRVMIPLFLLSGGMNIVALIAIIRHMRGR